MNLSINNMVRLEDITIIIVSYNSRIIIEKNLKKLSLIKTIVVDNYGDKKLKEILNHYNKITYINMGYNSGFAKANNAGAKIVKSKYMFICNPDISFEIFDLLILAEQFTKYKNLGIAGPSLYENLNTRTRNSSLKVSKKIFMRKPKHKKILNIIEKSFAEGDFCTDYIIGCSMMFETNFYNNYLHGFSEDFFIFFEDNEICDRTYSLGKVVMEFPRVKMIHNKNNSGNYNLYIQSKLAFNHKLSEYIYLKKNIKKILLLKTIFLNFIDYTQRFIFGILLLNRKKITKNFLRLCSIFYFILFK